MKATKRNKTFLPIFIIHWSWVVAFLVCFSTGIRIASDHIDWLNQTKISGLLPTPNPVFEWHLFGAAILCFSLISYIFYLFLQNKLSKLWPYQINSSQSYKLSIPTFIHFFGIILLLIMTLTGLFNYLEITNFPSDAIRLIHLSSAFITVLYILIHISIHFIYGGISLATKIFFFHFKTVKIGAFVLITCFLLIFIFYRSVSLLAIDLTVHKITDSPIVDGKSTDTAWKNIEPILLLNKHGNTKESIITIEIRSVRDKSNIYFFIRWPDEDKSLSHTPLLKTKNGWQTLEQGFYNNNETKWYEDKLALMLATNPLAALKSIHLSEQPILNAPSPLNKRGFHFTQNNEVLDIWHWKAWRTNSLFQAEDSYFSKPIIPRMCDRRYAAGYHSDPALSKGYKINWSYYNGQIVIPKRLPKSSQFSYVNYTQQSPNDIALFPGMRWDDTYQYHDKNDQLSFNTIIPATMTTGPIRGDRGDVRAKGVWKDGYWNLEMSRILDTGSNYDIAIQDGIYVWVSAFNHAQTKHSYHLRPLRLVIE